MEVSKVKICTWNKMASQSIHKVSPSFSSSFSNKTTNHKILRVQRRRKECRISYCGFISSSPLFLGGCYFSNIGGDDERGGILVRLGIAIRYYHFILCHGWTQQNDDSWFIGFHLLTQFSRYWDRNKNVTILLRIVSMSSIQCHREWTEVTWQLSAPVDVHRSLVCLLEGVKFIKSCSSSNSVCV